MKSNYKEKVKQINEFNQNLAEVAAGTPTIENVALQTKSELFGENIENLVREKIGADNILLTYEMINAELHFDLVKKCMGKLLRTDKYKDNEQEINSISLDYLCASICKALASKVKSINFSSYASVDYWQKHLDFLYKANNERVKLLAKLGLM